MRVSSVLYTVVGLVSVISLLSIWSYPSSHDFMAANRLWNGVNNFSREFDVATIDSLAELPHSAAGAVLVVIPYLESSAEELEKLRQFVADGGTLLLLDDYGYGNTILAYLGVDARFSRQPLLDPLFSYKNQWLPRITDFAPGVKGAGVNVVVLNHATALTGVSPSEVIARSAISSFLDTNENESWEPDEPKGPLAVAAVIPRGGGKLVLVSDPSIMINSMVSRDDNQKFIGYLTRLGGEAEIVLDRSYIPAPPLDASKEKLTSARRVLSSPYALLGIIAIIFLVVPRLILKKGEAID